eukprot:FR737908.1.p1 GENE.FR737908.1~~FR737908.1.p1  ORF type:complete len:173 (+),score=12.60 FR737908.1:38-556(+)
MTWPTTTWQRRISSTHHIWFLPLCLAATRGADVMPAYLLSNLIISMAAVVTRVLTPRAITLQRAPDVGRGHGPAPGSRNILEHLCGLGLLCGGSEGDGDERSETAKPTQEEPRYLNINLVYEVWKDVKFKAIQVTHPNPVIHIPRLLFIWGGLNLPCALLLWLASKLYWNAS